MLNKREIDRLIPQAYTALIDFGVAEGKKIDSAFRGQISSFGAAVAMGSLLSAVAFFSAQGSSAFKRQNLMKAIYRLIVGENNAETATVKDTDLFDYVRNNTSTRQREKETKTAVYNAAIALKLAMNLFELKA